MLAVIRGGLVSLTFIALLQTVSAQEAPAAKAPPPPPEPKKATPPPPPPPANAVAATVNGQEIPELAVYRAFLHDPSSNSAENRKEIVNHLIDNMLVDQYLYQLKIAVDQKEVEERFAQIDAEAIKNKQTLKEMLGRMHLTEEDLRKELLGAARWEKFLAAQGTDKVLREMFDKNPTMFNGTQIQARHILIPNKGDESVQQITTLRAAIEQQVQAEAAKLPASADPMTAQKERAALLAKIFSAYAAKDSTCPSKVKGGELGYFPRVGAMVEPFAKAAFALKPFEMSQPVQTEFGYHLILATDFRAGREVKFEDVRPLVQEVYGERLREAIIAAYKPRSKIVVTPAAK